MLLAVAVEIISNGSVEGRTFFVYLYFQCSIFRDPPLQQSVCDLQLSRRDVTVTPVI